MFLKAERRQARAFQADAKAINEKVRPYARIGASLIAAREAKHDAFGAITAVIPGSASARASRKRRLARPEESTPIRGLASAMSVFGVGLPPSSMRSNSKARRLPLRSCEPSRFCARRIAQAIDSAENGSDRIVRQRWAPHVLPGGVIDRRYYELCVLSELRDRLRAGDVWVAGSRQYRSFEERLISKETFRDLRQAGFCRLPSTRILRTS